MHTLEFKGHVQQTIIEAGQGNIPDHNLVAVYLETLEVFTDAMVSRDTGGKREGYVRIKCAGQESVIPFFGIGRVIPKYANKLLFLGKKRNDLPFHMELVEVDEEERVILSNVEKIVELLKGSPLAGLHPAASPGLGLLGSIIRVIRNHIKDAREFQAFITVDQVQTNNRKMKLEIGSSPSKILMKMVLLIEDLGKPQSLRDLGVKVGGWRIELDENVKLELADGVLVVGDTHAASSTKIRPVLNFGNHQFVPWIKRTMKWMNVEIASGDDRFVFSTDLKSVENKLVHWNNSELFVTRVPRADADRHLVPFSMSVTMNPQELNVKDMHEIGNGLLDLAKSMGYEIPQDKIADVIKKSTPSLISFLSEVSEKSFSLYSFNGLLLLDPPSGGGGHQAQSPGRMVLHMSATSRDTWTAQVSQELKWKDKKVGTLSFDLEIRAV